MSDLKYEPVNPVTRKELIRRLESDDPEVVASALYASTKYDEDWKWVQDQCLKRLKSSEVSVRWAAATCLGDLAFLRRPLDVDAVVSALELATRDPQIADPASFSLSMVKQFLDKQ
jgi:HEAT repeat